MSILDNFVSEHIYPGFKISNISYDKQNNSALIELFPVNSPRCARCHSYNVVVHEYRTRIIKDSKLFGINVTLKITYRTFRCSCCGAYTTERIDFITKSNHNITLRLENEVIDDLEKAGSIKDTSIRFNVDWKICKKVHKDYLKKKMYFHLDDAKILLIDEIAIKKHHVYATVVVDQETRRVIWVEEGKEQKDVSKFFRKCGSAGCEQIKAVAMDQNACFPTVVKKFCPQAVVVYDLFHVVANFGRNVISAIRLRLANSFKVLNNLKGYKRLKRSRLLLLTKTENLSDEGILRLKDILEYNRELYEAYILKEKLPLIWKASSKEEAIRLWDEWVSLAKQATAPEVRNFVRTQDKYYRDGITNSGIYHIGTSILEGINNKIKVLKRLAYGYRDFEYFRLRIMSAFRGKELPQKDVA